MPMFGFAPQDVTELATNLSPLTEPLSALKQQDLDAQKALGGDRSVCAQTRDQALVEAFALADHYILSEAKGTP
jgi:hypothetical protein